MIDGGTRHWPSSSSPTALLVHPSTSCSISSDGQPLPCARPRRSQRSGRRLRERELADLREEAAEERLLGLGRADRLGDRAAGDGIDEASVPEELKVEAAGLTLARQVRDEREPERQHLEWARSPSITAARLSDVTSFPRL